MFNWCKMAESPEATKGSKINTFIYILLGLVLLVWVGIAVRYFAPLSGISGIKRLVNFSQGPVKEEGLDTEVAQEDTSAEQESADDGKSPFSPDTMESNESSPKTTPFPEFKPEGPVSEWPVYTNEEFGYSIRYPLGTTPRDQGAVGSNVLNLTNFVASEGVTFPVVGVKVVSTPYEDLEEQMWSLAKGDNYKTQAAKIGGVDGVQVSGAKQDGTKIYEAIVPSQKTEGSIRILTGMAKEQEENLKTFDKMVKSFSFL